MVMRATLGLLLAVTLFCGCSGNRSAVFSISTAPRPGPGVFFVATNGNDAWTGGRATANARQSDGPFATVPRALTAAREFRQSHGTAATICLRGGTHFLSEPLTLKPEDSQLKLVAYGREHPVLSGGRRIAGWHEERMNGRKMWVTEVPEARDGKWFFRELWVNGKRATHARSPNWGYHNVAEALDTSSEWTKGQSRLRFAEGALKAWPSVSNAEVVVMTKWVESRLPVVSVDEAQRIVNFGKRAVFQLATGDPYYVEGAFELLDTPGEWCLEPARGKLFYIPQPNERVNEVEVIAPALTQLVRLEGRPEAGVNVAGITFRGLRFAHSEWNLPGPDAKSGGGWPAPPTEIGGFNQAAVGVPGAVWGEGVRGCVFERCEFSHLGSYGLELARGCQSNRITHCEFADLGAGGIKIGEQAIRQTAAEQSGANEVSGCRIHDGGKMFQSAIGVWIGQSPNNRLTHNLIHDFYYTGISIGWTWGYGPALASNNLVAFNHIHHIGVASDGDGPVLSDMGGIYTLGKQPGTRIVNNLWHDIAGLRYGGWGIYFDEGSSGILAESNVVYRTTHGGFHQHYGETNVVRNNIFAYGRDQQLQRSREEDHLSFSFSNNIVLFDQGVLLGSTWKNERFAMDGNVYWDTRATATPESMRFAKASLEAWRARGHDQHSILTDPLFVAPQNDDFRLKRDSPALKLGFHPIDVRGVGPRP